MTDEDVVEVAKRTRFRSAGNVVFVLCMVLSAAHTVWHFGDAPGVPVAFVSGLFIGLTGFGLALWILVRRWDAKAKADRAAAILARQVAIADANDGVSDRVLRNAINSLRTELTRRARMRGTGAQPPGTP